MQAGGDRGRGTRLRLLDVYGIHEDLGASEVEEGLRSVRGDMWQAEGALRRYSSVVLRRVSDGPTDGETENVETAVGRRQDDRT